MGLAQSAVAFDHTVTTTFGQRLTLWGAIGTVGCQGLALWSAIGTVRCQGLALWGAFRTVRCQGLTLWSAVRTVLNQTFLFQTITAAFSYGLTLWGFVIAILNQAFFFQAVTTVFSQGLALWSAVRAISGNSLAEHRVAGFDLRSRLIGSWQGESGAGQHREGKTEQKLAFHDGLLLGRAIKWVRGQCYSR